MKYRKTRSFLALGAVVLASSRYCHAIDQAGLTGEFSLPDRPRNLVDSQDEYYDAVQRLRGADAAVVQAREAAIKESQSSAEYIAAVKAVDAAFHAFTEKKIAVISDLEKTNPVYSQMKSQATAMDAKIDAARENPQTTPEQFEDLYKNRDTFQKQWHQLESDAMDRAGITPLQQQWIDASKKLSDLKDRQQVAAESNDRLKGAIAMAEEARTAVDQARAAISGGAVVADANNEQPGAGDFLRRYSRTGFAGNDAWWTYGWSGITPSSKTSVTSAPGK